MLGCQSSREFEILHGEIPIAQTILTTNPKTTKVMTMFLELRSFPYIDYGNGNKTIVITTLSRHVVKVNELLQLVEKRNVVRKQRKLLNASYFIAI